MDKVKVREDHHHRPCLSACLSHSYAHFVTPTGPCLCVLFFMDRQALQRHKGLDSHCSGGAQGARL